MESQTHMQAVPRPLQGVKGSSTDTIQHQHRRRRGPRRLLDQLRLTPKARARTTKSGNILLSNSLSLKEYENAKSLSITKFCRSRRNATKTISRKLIARHVYPSYLALAIAHCSIYLQLALQLHPDKNGAPGADEAFKSRSFSLISSIFVRGYSLILLLETVVSKAFQVLSEPGLRAAFDRDGGDPESRFGGGGMRTGGAG